MFAAWYERLGPAAEVIQVGELDTPAPGSGEVLVRLHASGVNPADGTVPKITLKLVEMQSKFGAVGQGGDLE